MNKKLPSSYKQNKPALKFHYTTVLLELRFDKILPINSINHHLLPLYFKGCIDAMIDWAEEHLVVIGGIGVGIAIIQVGNRVSLHPQK